MLVKVDTSVSTVVGVTFTASDPRPHPHLAQSPWQQSPQQQLT